MFLKTLKDTEKYFWTEHAKFKMKFYGLSPQRVLRVIRAPQRTEEGIVEKTIAVMQPASRRRVSASRGGPAREIWSQEIWAMYQLRGSGAISKSQFPISKKIPNPKFQKLQTKNYKLKIISAWRYPGMSSRNNPIPEEILTEIKDVLQ
jgi:hypothetical protein